MSFDAFPILATAAGTPWREALGRFHVVLVHFPIALLVLAAVVETWSWVRRKGFSSTAALCLILGTAAAGASAWSGWVHAGARGDANRTLQWHLYLGFAATGVALVSILILAMAKWKPIIFTKPYRFGVIAGALLVGLAGHFGGSLTHGEGYLTELLLPPKTEVAVAKDGAKAMPASLVKKPIAFPADGKIDFARDVQPIFEQSCYQCHSATKVRGRLRLDSKSLFFAGGNSGHEVVVGKSGDSVLIKRVLGEGNQKRMPLDHPPLPDEQIRILRAWVDQGAVWPDHLTNDAATQEQHWAYKPPSMPAIPPVKDAAWCRNPIDNFVLARLEDQGLKPSPQASRETLIRRLSLDLIGLPPTPQEVSAFVRDTSENAYENLVSRLLASPHYGERWGRHWLDIARYADTNGYEKDNPRVIWPYRDWVINALNRDMGFDQFVIQQMAGDMLPNATAEERIATGFHRNTMFNEEGGIDVEEFRFKAIVDRVQTTSTAFLGLTMHCAQCHNHKYDQISQKEYYQFFALLNNADEPFMDVPSAAIDEQRRQATERIDKLTSELEGKFPARDESMRWEIIKPRSIAAESKAALTLQPDGSILASGTLPQTDTYTITAPLNLDGVVAFRLEALTDPSLPRNGPGRQGASGVNGQNRNGNFVLSQFKAEWAPIVKPWRGAEVLASRATTQPSVLKRIKIDRAEADYNQPDFEIAKAIDDYFTKGWSVGGRGGQTNKNHHAIFYTPEKLTGTQDVTITLKQLYKKHTLGKFRLSVGRPPPPPSTQPTEEDRKKFLAQQFEAWEKSIAPRCANWAVLEPAKFERLHEGTITKLPDNSLLFTGDNLYREEYRLSYRTPAKNITAIRIEALPHEALPRGGPGRNPNGGFLLSELNAIASSTTRPAATQPVSFESVSADVADDSAERAIDGKKDTHWTVSAPGQRPVQAVFKLKDKLAGFEGGTTLDLSLVQNYFQSENIGRVRISVTTDEHAGEASTVPADIEQIILAPGDKRTPEQAARLKEHFLLSTPFLAAQQKEIADARAAMPAHTTTLVMQERIVPRTTRLHHRGEYLQPRDPVGAGAVPAVLPPLPKDQPANRMTLAKWLVSAQNPLTSRVVMNRVWNQYFGRGITNSVEDFGVMGEKPSHPELLDYLAVEFQRQHWSMKAMHRLIVTSATYRQSSRITPDLLKRDPQNVLLARGPRFRVEAEIVRDIALRASGLLNETVGGPSVFPPQPPGVSELSYGPLKWNESVGPDRYRRGMYTFLKRTAMYPMETTFDGPTAEIVCARRVRSNTPLQALTTLNDVVFVEAAQALARRIVEEGPKEPAQRAKYLFEACVARAPDAVELDAIVNFYQGQLTRLRQDKKLEPAKLALADGAKKPRDLDVTELAAWTTVARSVMNLDETVTKE